MTGQVVNPNAAAPTPVPAANAAVAPAVVGVAVLSTSEIAANAATVVEPSRALAPTSTSCGGARTVTRTRTVTRIVRETIIAT